MCGRSDRIDSGSLVTAFGGGESGDAAQERSECNGEQNDHGYGEDEPG